MAGMYSALIYYVGFALFRSFFSWFILIESNEFGYNWVYYFNFH